MAAVEVAKLKIRCDTRVRERTRFAIEDGLRTTIPDDPRLVLLRKMRIGGRFHAADPAEHQAAIKDGWLAAIAGARHGGDDGAKDANCVWFASRDEAEDLLLSRLLAGRLVDDWFWKLAVPGWRGCPIRDWLSQCVSEALATGEDNQLLAIARTCVAASATERLVEALATTEQDREGLPARPAADVVPPPSSSAYFNQFSGHVAHDDAAVAAMSIPPKLRAAIVILVRAGGDARAAAHAIIRAWVVRRSPALIISPSLLASTVAATVAAVVSELPVKPRRERRANGLPSAPIVKRGESSAAAPKTMRTDRLARDRVRHRGTKAQAPGDACAAVEPPLVSTDPDTPPLAPEHRHSRHAGLWLVIPSLVELGFREWLAARPALLGDNPGGLLLQAIARHHRVPPDDPALAILGAPTDIDTFPFWSRMWRHGLDRWLRRTVRRRLHDLVNRPGELHWSEFRLDVRYPSAAADLALRRRALDRDPGWTDWLALSIRYHFGGTEDWL